MAAEGDHVTERESIEHGVKRMIEGFGKSGADRFLTEMAEPRKWVEHMLNRRLTASDHDRDLLDLVVYLIANGSSASPPR